MVNEDKMSQPLDSDDDDQSEGFQTVEFDRDQLSEIIAEDSGVRDDAVPDWSEGDHALVANRVARQAEASSASEGACDAHLPLSPEEGIRKVRATKGPRGGGAAAIAVVVAMFLLAGIAVAFVTYGMELWGGRSIPDVADGAEDKARAALEERGFRVTIERRVSDGPEGRALGTSPGAGARADEGSAVMLYVSLARKIPDVKGMTLDEARHAIEAMGAESFAIEHVASSEREGSVVGVKPEPGSPFLPSDTIVISVAQAFAVPYVVGRSEEEAVASIQKAGLVPKVTYKASEKKGGVVLSANPGQGAKVQEGSTVELTVASYCPSDYRCLAQYFDCPASKMARCLTEMGFSLESSYVDDEGNVQARYSSPGKGRLTFESEPFTMRFDASHGAGPGIVDGSSYLGIRLDFARDVPTSAKELSQKALQEIADACAFTGMSERQSSASARFPAGTNPKETPFVCGSGRQNGYTWTVLIVKEGDDVRVAATCVPTSLYDEYDLSEFGGSVCSFAAYADIYVR
ncbi:MAG: PASTA domain-containing protein [Olsenella sp.]|nr:PASTA domain-containing protein [Olsenella sp.]